MPFIKVFSRRFASYSHEAHKARPSFKDISSVLAGNVVPTVISFLIAQFEMATAANSNCCIVLILF